MESQKGREMRAKDKFKKGSIEMILLKILSVHDCYGYQITQIIKRISNDSISVQESSMYPILYRLQERGMITSYTQKGNGHMERVYYHIEAEGCQELESLIADYRQVQQGIEKILNYPISLETVGKVR